MRIFLTIVLAILCACGQPASFSGRVQFQVAMQPDEWEGFLAKSDELLPATIYTGKHGEVVRTPGSPPILYIEKTSQNEQYKVIVAQRAGRKKLSVILYTADKKPTDRDWHEEATRLEAFLRNRFGEALSVNYGAVTEIPY